MKADDLKYESLTGVIKSFEEKGREEARSFLNWFLENIMRLDPIEADDSICDKPNDRGIDAIYIDTNQEEVLVFQGKIRQKESTIGDSPLRELAGTLTQLQSVASIDALVSGGGNDDLKNLVIRSQLRDRVASGWSVIGVFITNQTLDANGAEFLASHGRLRVYDRHSIAAQFIDIESEGGVKSKFSFDTSYCDYLKMTTKTGVNSYLLPVQATELVRMAGIEDGTLFSQNVRQSLARLIHRNLTVAVACA